MVEDDFNDIFDSEDDAFFVAASNSIDDYESCLSEHLMVPRKIFENQSSASEDFENQNSKEEIKDVSTPQPKLDSFSSIPSVEDDSGKSLTPSYINKRFTPGFTPKAKKRKFAGPAGLLDLSQANGETSSNGSQQLSTVDSEFENIPSSQFPVELLSSSSWQKLQTAVSSHLNLHSTVKFYSIQRVLQESSKKKLPKHMVVPVLCVMLKELKKQGSSLVPVFIDDTGEIIGKISAEVLFKYKEYMVEGTALILKKVTILCNVLILKLENLVSIYLPHGSECHLENLESILNAEPLKPMNCECLKQTRNSCISNGSLHRPDCFAKRRDISNISLPNKKTFSSPLSSHKAKNIRTEDFLEDLVSEENALDEFDELLVNLDETVFMDEL